jgi:hypothetical protein
VARRAKDGVIERVGARSRLTPLVLVRVREHVAK